MLTTPRTGQTSMTQLLPLAVRHQLTVVARHAMLDMFAVTLMLVYLFAMMFTDMPAEPNAQKVRFYHQLHTVSALTSSRETLCSARKISMLSMAFSPLKRLSVDLSRSCAEMEPLSPALLEP